MRYVTNVIYTFVCWRHQERVSKFCDEECHRMSNTMYHNVHAWFSFLGGPSVTPIELTNVRLIPHYGMTHCDSLWRKHLLRTLHYAQSRIKPINWPSEVSKMY